MVNDITAQQEKTVKPAKPSLATISGKRAYTKLGGLTPSMFGRTTLELHKDRVVEVTKGPIYARDCHVSIAEIDSAEVVTCGNQLYLIAGIVTLGFFGLGLLFLLLYFFMKHKFLVIHSASNALAVVIKGDPEPYHDFKKNAIKLTNHYKLNR